MDNGTLIVTMIGASVDSGPDVKELRGSRTWPVPDSRVVYNVASVCSLDLCFFSSLHSSQRRFQLFKNQVSSLSQHRQVSTRSSSRIKMVSFNIAAGLALTASIVVASPIVNARETCGGIRMNGECTEFCGSAWEALSSSSNAKCTPAKRQVVQEEVKRGETVVADDCGGLLFGTNCKKYDLPVLGYLDNSTLIADGMIDTVVLCGYLPSLPTHLTALLKNKLHTGSPIISQSRFHKKSSSASSEVRSVEYLEEEQ